MQREGHLIKTRVGLRSEGFSEGKKTLIAAVKKNKIK